MSTPRRRARLRLLTRDDYAIFRRHFNALKAVITALVGDGSRTTGLFEQKSLMIVKSLTEIYLSAIRQKRGGTPNGAWSGQGLDRQQTPIATPSFVHCD